MNKYFFNVADNKLTVADGKFSANEKSNPQSTLGETQDINIQFQKDSTLANYTTFLAGTTARFLVDLDYKNPGAPIPLGSTGWSLSSGFEYKLILSQKPDVVTFDDITASEGTVGALVAGEWGYITGTTEIVVRLSDDTDPSTKADDFILVTYTNDLATPLFIEASSDVFNLTNSWLDSDGVTFRTPDITKGEVSFTLNSNTVNFFNRLSGSPKKDCFAEIQFFEPSTALFFMKAKFNYTCTNRLLTSGEDPLELVGVDVYVKAEIDAQSAAYVKEALSSTYPEQATVLGTERVFVRDGSTSKQTTINKITTYISSVLAGTFLAKLFSAYSSKTTLVGADTIAINDSAASFAPKEASLTNVLAFVSSEIGAIVVLQGDWNASTNTPDITSTTITGHAWRVSVAGSTDLDGITDWEIGDIAVKTATGWLKIDNTDGVISVFGRQGVVIAVAGDYTADKIEMSELGTATYDDLQDWSDTTQSAGIIDGGEITDATSGAVDVAAVKGIIKTTNSDIGENLFFDLAGLTGQSLTDETTNYIAIDYNAGTPQWVVGTTSTANGHTIFNVGKIFREGNSLDIIISGLRIYDFSKRVQQHHVDEAALHFTSGATVSETGIVNIGVSAGVMYAGINRMTSHSVDTSKSEDITGGGTGGTISANNTIVLDSGEGDVTDYYIVNNRLIIENSSNGNDGTYHVVSSSFDGTNTTVIITEITLTTGADTGNVRPHSFEYYYYNGSAWVESNQTDIDNLQYNDIATGLATLSNNQYGVHWVYKGTNGTTFVLYGQDSYTLVLASAAQPPASVPPHVSGFAVLRAKVIILKSAVVFTEIQNADDTAFTGSGAVNHNDTGNLDTGDFLHLTAAQRPIATQAASGTVSGYVNIIAQTFKGIKTFLSFPITPSSAPTTDYQVANKKYVDDNAGGGTDWDVAVTTTSITMTAGVAQKLDSSGGAITRTFPTTPANGDTFPINIVDSTNTITIARNGHKINGEASDDTSLVAGDTVTFVYDSTNDNFFIDNEVTSGGGDLTKDYELLMFNIPGVLDTDSTTAMATLAKFRIYWNLPDATLVQAQAEVATAVSTGTEPSINIVMDAGGTPVDALSSDLSLNETLATGTINTSNDDIDTGQEIEVDFLKGNGDGEDVMGYLKFQYR